MDEQLKSNLLSSHHWLRLAFMVLFAILLQVAGVVMWVVVCLQFIFSLLTGRDNIQLRSFGGALTQYVYQSLRFLTYNTEEKPFPFSDWPEMDLVDDGSFIDEADVITSPEDNTGEKAVNEK
ncbi:MAG: DUF4389 domain-containing protein [Cellvibrionaceae bacterium]